VSPPDREPVRATDAGRTAGAAALRTPSPDGGTAGRRWRGLDALADRRGLTALGAVAVALTLGVVGGAWDVATGPGLRQVFAACFVVGCGLAALTVHREDVRAAVVMPPLVYLALAVLGGVVERAGTSGSFVEQQALELANALVLGAPVLISATAVALLVGVGRVVLEPDAPS